ncbi:S8 family serine peptidase [Eupransor demetentiae]|uniref:Subtilisin family (AprE) n=1 Tax=Eupransor demetentiae TaxID=3109584 RepID=A0ABM9N4B8_9LACO|nr:Serine protease [Lactobacillaceae bacterium LMG 33000]
MLIQKNFNSSKSKLHYLFGSSLLALTGSMALSANASADSLTTQTTTTTTGKHSRNTTKIVVKQDGSDSTDQGTISHKEPASSTASSSSQSDSDSANSSSLNLTSAQPKEATTTENPAASNLTASNIAAPANQADLTKINANQAWQNGYTGKGQVVAVIDTGIDASNPAFTLADPTTAAITKEAAQARIKELGYGEYLSEKIPFAYNYVSNSSDNITNNANQHGQHVAGTVAANGPVGNKEYTMGIAPDAQILAMRVQDDGNNIDAIAKAIHDAVDLGANVIQISYGTNYAAQQKQNELQAAVNYASQHGVLVAVSSGNDGNSGSIISADNATPGTDTLAYQPVNSGTIGDPGTADTAITVAAENSLTGDQDAMFNGSSWGPMPDLTLKPDISAPGVGIVSTYGQDDYKKAIGTSMAAPHVSGSALLVNQHLKTLNMPSSANLAMVEKLMLMNTATPKVDYAHNTYISPRQQGAGGLNTGAAVENTVTVNSANGQGSASLYAIGEQTNFDLTLTNYSDQDHSYSISNLGGPMTDLVDPSTKQSYDQYLSGASLTAGKQTVTVPAHSQVTVPFNLNLTDVSKQKNVEGFVQFKSLDGQPDLSVPYYGYYGDPTQQSVFDASANQADSYFGGNYLLDNQNFPMGVTDTYSLKSMVSGQEKYDWQQVAKLVQDGKVAFSPKLSNGPSIMPYEFTNQNLQDLKVEILDKTGRVVRTISDNKDVSKSSYRPDTLGTNNMDLALYAKDLSWDGTLYNSQTDTNYVAPDGEYTYRLTGTLWTDGSNKVQSVDYPVIIDTTAPEVTDLTYDQNSQTIDIHYKDEGSGFTDYSVAKVLINNHVKTVPMAGSFTDASRTTGDLKVKLDADDLAAMGDTHNVINVVLSDVANNTAGRSLITDAVASGNPVVLYNAVPNVPLNKDGGVYDAKTDIFQLYGATSLPSIDVNNQIVYPDADGYFTANLKLADSPSIKVTNPANGQVLTEFSLAYPQASFEWASVAADPNDSSQMIVTAQVPQTEGGTTNAFIRNYATNDVYTGQVQNGVATFTVPKPATDSNVILDGWSTLYMADGTAIHSGTNTVNVQGNQIPKDLTVVNATGMGAASASWNVQNPTLPGRNNPNTADTTDSDLQNKQIHFDNVNNNGSDTHYGREAVTDGYYNEESQLFTVTGTVSNNVQSLKVMTNSSYASDSANNVAIDKNGHFSFTIPMKNTELKGVAYQLQTKSGDTKNGMVQVLLDTVAPSLTINQNAGDETVQNDANTTTVYTKNPSFTLSGQANDNLDGYRFFINDDNLYTEYKVAGYSGINGSVNGDLNPYPAHNFSQTYQLNDNGDQSTTHTYNVKVVDQLGNTTSKKVIVNYQAQSLAAPSYVQDGQTVTVLNPKSGDQYSTDGGQTWSAYTRPLELESGNLQLRTQDASGNTSSTVTVPANSNSSKDQLPTVNV